MLVASSLTRGDVVLAAFPFADLSATKRRPVVIVGVNPSYGEVTLAFVTSQNTAFASANEVLLLLAHPEFSLTGPSVASKLRAGKLVTLAPQLLTRKLVRHCTCGRISKGFRIRLPIPILETGASPPPEKNSCRRQ